MNGLIIIQAVHNLVRAIFEGFRCVRIQNGFIEIKHEGKASLIVHLKACGVKLRLWRPTPEASSTFDMLALHSNEV